MTYSPDTDKIDSEATLGLLGVANSLAYRVHEIEKHFHSEEHWYGDDGGGGGSTATNLTEWQLVAGAGLAYGAEVAILDANDVSAADFSFTPVKFDLHRVFVTDQSVVDKLYMIQFWGGATTFGAATLLSEVPFRAGTNKSEVSPIPLQMPRQAVASKVWARAKCETNAGTLDFIIGVHAYAG